MTATPEVGFGRLGVRSGLRTFSDLATETAFEKRVAIEFRPKTPVTGWSLHSGSTYVAAFEYQTDGVRLDVVGIHTGVDASLSRVESVADCAAGVAYYYNPDAFSVASSARWDDGTSNWDEVLLYWDQFNKVYVCLSDGSNPDNSTVSAEVGLYVSGLSSSHPHLGQSKLTNGDFETWGSASDLSSFTESGTVSREETIIKNGTYAAKCSISNGAPGASSTIKNTTDMATISGALYRVSGHYYTPAENTSGLSASLRVQDTSAGDLMDDGRSLASLDTQTFALDDTYGEWRRFVFDFIAPGTAAKVWVGVTNLGSSQATGYAIFDDVALQRIYRFNYYAPRVNSASVPQSTAASNDIFFGGKQIGTGSLTLNNSDSRLDKLVGDLDWENAEVRIYFGGAFLDGQELTIDDYRQAFTGLVQSLRWSDRTVMLDMQDSRAFFHVRLPKRVYLDTEHANLDTSFNGNVRPIWFGAKENIKPVGLSTDTSTGYGTYELCDVDSAPNGIKAVTAVYAYDDESAADDLDSNKRVALSDIDDFPGIAPDVLTGVVLTGWWKADAGVFSDAGTTPATNGGTVQQWNDQSGSARHFSQATAGSRPTYETDQVNSLPALRFVKSGTDYMDTTATFADFFNNDSGTVFVVWKPTTLNTSATSSLATTAEALVNNAGGFGGLYLHNAPRLYAMNNDGTEDIASDSLVDATSWQIAAWRHGGGAVYAYATDVRDPWAGVATSGNTSTITNVMRIGRSGGSAIYSDIQVAEIVMFEGSLTETQRQEVERYLRNRFGLTLNDDIGYSADLALARISITSDVGPYTVEAAANQLQFNIGASELTATITAGLYTAKGLAHAAAEAMTTAAATPIEVTHSETAHNFTVAKASGALTLLCKTGSSEAKLWPLLGFSVSSDLSGSLSYTGDQTTFESAYDDHVIRVDGQGMKDDASGTFTGTANALIEIGADICRTLLVRYLGKPSSIVDESSFDFARSRAPEALALYLNESVSTQEIFDRLEYSNIANIVIDGAGIVYYEVYVGDVPNGIITLDDSDFVEFGIERGVTDVYSFIRVQHDQDPSTGEWEGRTASSDEVSVRFGRGDSRTFPTYIKSGDNAYAAASRLLELAKIPARIVSGTVKGKLIDARVGQKIRITRSRALDPNGKLSSKTFRIISLTQMHQGARTTFSAVDDVVTVAGIACINSCQAFCEQSCQTACEAACQSTCESACQVGCEVGCEETCQSSCQSTCETSCQTACELVCQTACQTVCQGGCQTGCETACEISCQATCEAACQSTCELTCQTACQVSCESACQVSCQVGCEVSCQTGCEISCQQTCETSCQESCEVSCQTNCELFCQTSCQSVCQVETEQVGV